MSRILRIWSFAGVALTFLTCSFDCARGGAASSTASLQAILERGVRTALDSFRDENLLPSEIAASLVSLRDPAQPAWANVRGDVAIYPASVVKLFYLVAVHRWLEDANLQDTPELRRALKDMIVVSSNDATSYVVDLLTGTMSGPELSDAEIKLWSEKRNAVNRYFSGLGYTGININKKPWGDGPYGRETQAMGLFEPSRNQLTTNAVARLLVDIAQGHCITSSRSREMLELLSRTPTKETTNPDDQAAFTGAALPPGAKLWSKAGWTSQVRHDAALVELPGGLRFVLVVFTSNHASQHEIIRTVARVVIDALASDVSR